MVDITQTTIQRMVISFLHSLCYSSLYHLAAPLDVHIHFRNEFIPDEENGRKDFDNTIQELVVPSGIATVDYSVSIPINNDLINEADEGFLVVVRANENKSDPQDTAELEYIGEGVTLAIISDDDGMLTSIVLVIDLLFVSFPP